MDAALNALTTSEEAGRLAEIERRHGEMSTQVERMRLYLAAKTQETAKFHRQIDDVPTRSELIQYERRFVELFDQVAACIVCPCQLSMVVW
jgi:hypothetical protein